MRSGRRAMRDRGVGSYLGCAVDHGMDVDMVDRRCTIVIMCHWKWLWLMLAGRVSVERNLGKSFYIYITCTADPWDLLHGLILDSDLAPETRKPVHHTAPEKLSIAHRMGLFSTNIRGTRIEPSTIWKLRIIWQPAYLSWSREYKWLVPAGSYLFYS